MIELINAIDPQVQIAIVGGFFAIVAAFLERFRKKLNEIRYHVQNDHKTNLREDIDRALVGIDKALVGIDNLAEGQARHDEILASHGASIGGIRDDLRTSRKEHLALSGRVDNLIFALPN